ncbi:MAG: nitroreductase family protein [Kiritimatiellae bacterium]|nr:nitroreductase family protein [Kiritimatiellia bacterium]
MSTFLDLCRSRQSCRNYDPHRPVPREALDRCIEAARLAPSACNSQPWMFVVVDRPELKRRVAEAAFGGAYSMNRFAADAPVLVVMVTERSKRVAQMGAWLRRVPYNRIDIGIAGEHFCLQAAEEGLGACWLGWFNAPAVRRALELPRGARLDVMFSVGWPDQPVREKNRKPAEAMSRYA